MPTIGSITKTIRINASDLDTVQRLMKSEELSWSGAFHRLVEAYGSKNPEKSGASEGVPRNYIEISDETYLSLMGMIAFYGGSLENLVIMLDKAMNDGSVMYEDGRIVGVPQVDLERLYDVCHEANIDPQEAIDRLVKEMER